MKTKILIPILFIIPQAKAVTTFTADFSGSIGVAIKHVTHYRHSGDCYWEAKAPKETNHIPQTLPLTGGLQSGKDGSYIWTSALTSPFSREIRKLNLTTTSTSNSSKEEWKATLVDTYNVDEWRNAEGSCWHTNGYTRPSQAKIQGQLKVHYTIPENVWAVRVTRSGKGLLHLSHMKSMQGALNSGYDKAVEREEIFWVKPGTQLTQEVVIPVSTPGNTELGDITLTFEPIAKDLTLDKDQFTALKRLKQYAKLVSTKGQITEIASEEFIQNAMGLILFYHKFTTVPSQIPTQELTNISKDLFAVANATIPSAKLGLAVKTAAALASYEIAMKLLTDLSTYCDTVDVYLPMKNQTVKVLGLRAASFWLTRGISSIKNYKFDQYNAFVQQLADLENGGVTYENVRNNPNTSNQILTAFNFLSDTIDVGGSPFRAALKDVQRTLKQFGAIGSNNSDTAALVATLSELSRLEDTFVRELFKSMDSFSLDSREVIKGLVFQNQLKALQKAQAALTSDMEKNIRLLSIDGGSDATSAMSVMMDLLSHQVAIFEMPLNNVPYFESLRAEYFRNKNRISTIEKSKMCVTGER